tara:strand:+ start:18691 stop:20373 length:1683 start_codon:yes stop_codon:yes gene_type:complete
MATRKVTVEVEAKTGTATSEIKDLQNGIGKLNDEVVKGNKQTEKGLKGVEKSAEGTSKGVRGIGNALKGVGIGLAIAAFAKLVEVFNENQKVLDFFNITFEVLSLAFNDFFNFLNNNIGTVIDYFKQSFEDPMQNVKDFGNAIKENLIERFESFLDTLGFLASAVKKVFSGDFAGALDDVKLAGKESLDVLTGVNDSFDKSVDVVTKATKSISDYAKSTIDSAKAIVDLNKQAELASVINQGLIEKYDRQAEQQRQIRDDETKTIAERIAANNKLGEVLEEQQKLMLDNVDITIKAAQAEYDKNQNQENYIALLEAQNEREAVLAQIEGFRSEQLINKIGLEKELIDLKKEADEDEKDRLEAADEAQKKRDEEAAARAEKIIEAKKREREEIYKNLDAVIDAAGQESDIGKALFLAKEAMRIKDMIAEAQATIQKITMKAAEAGVDTSAGFAKTAAAGFPQNVPLLIAFAAQAAGIMAAVNSAVGSAKGAASSAGGGGGGGSVASAPAAPVFNVVGAAPENQLAQAIGEKESKPQKAYIVASDVTSQQALDRNIIESASI